MGKGGGEGVGEGNGLYPKERVCYPKERASRCLVQSSLILNLLKRMSSLFMLDKQKTINEATLHSL